MKYIYLIFGFLFFSNPYLGPIDYLPDFIGLLFIVKALKPLSEVSPSAEAAISSFKKAAVVSGAQIAVYIMILSMINSEPSFNLLYSSAFAVLRIIFLVPAFNEMFNCLSFFSERSTSKIRHIKRTKVSVLAFTIFHCIFSALPEIVYLKVYEIPNDYGDGSVAYFPLAAYRTGVLVICAFIVLVIGLVWFVHSTITICKLRKDRAFNSVIYEDLSRVDHSIKKTVLKSLTPAIFLLNIATFTSFSYFVDGKPLIPPYIAPIFFVIALGYIKNMTSKKITRIFPTIAIIFGLLMYLGCEMFAYSSHNTALINLDEVKTQFMLPLLLNAIYTLCMVISQIEICRAITITIREHTGLFWENAFITHNAKVGKIKLRQQFYAILIAILFSLTLVFNLVSYALIYSRPILNLISVAISLVLSFAFSTLLSSIKRSVIEKYTTDNKFN